MDSNPQNHLHKLPSFHQVAFSYAGQPFIENLSFSLSPAKVIGLIGANGAGKSTILKLASGLLTPHGGEVRLGDQPVAAYEARRRAELLAYLPQNLDAHLPFRVIELVGMGSYPRRQPQSCTTRQALAIVGLDAKAQARLSELSGGELKRAFIAMTLVQGARCLLLDEPLAGLDLKYQAQLLKLVREIAIRTGVCIFMSLHDMGAARRLDHLLALKSGRLVKQGHPREILTSSLMTDLFDLDDEEVALAHTAPC
ncbi:ABC transporter ATP-binding protein [Geoalkalibacter sp.]|uniref:ABC transporter ATP-binding protein n=1 Tax=Geoalkalibacter sp. TaxID=3041440 RepID=UPI00272EAE96|nr:ABC transporter ATP-binding protein [Geoalkalibacter sp.]